MQSGGSGGTLSYQPIESLPAGETFGLPINPHYFIPLVGSSCFFKSIN